MQSVFYSDNGATYRRKYRHQLSNLSFAADSFKKAPTHRSVLQAQIVIELVLRTIV